MGCVQFKFYFRPKLLKLLRGTDIEVDEPKNPDQCAKKRQRDSVVYVDGKKPFFR